MNVYKYIHVAADGRSVPIAFTYKTPFIEAATAPSVDYVLATDAEKAAYFIDKNQRKASLRKNRGVEYSQEMDSRLIYLGDTFSDVGTSAADVHDFRYLLSTLLDPTRTQVESGYWLTAKDVADEIVPDPAIDVIIANNNLGAYFNQVNSINSIKAEIDQAILDLY